MLSYFPVINDCLAWKLGNGISIRVGQHPMVGARDFYILVDELV